jgi:hypothetical protein
VYVELYNRLKLIIEIYKSRLGRYIGIVKRVAKI